MCPVSKTHRFNYFVKWCIWALVVVRLCFSFLEFSFRVRHVFRLITYTPFLFFFDVRYMKNCILLSLTPSMASREIGRLKSRWNFVCLHLSRLGFYSAQQKPSELQIQRHYCLLNYIYRFEPRSDIDCELSLYKAVYSTSIKRLALFTWTSSSRSVKILTFIHSMCNG